MPYNINILTALVSGEIAEHSGNLGLPIITCKNEQKRMNAIRRRPPSVN